MALITRVSRLFRADFHAVLDRIEEPEILLKQAVREMQEEITRIDRKLKVLRHEQSHLSTRRTELDQVLAQTEQELDICFKSNKEDLARALVRRKLESEYLRKLLDQQYGNLKNQLAEYDTRLTDNRSRLVAMQQKVELLTEDNSLSKFDDCFAVPEFSVRDDEVEVAFLLEKQKRNPS